MYDHRYKVLQRLTRARHMMVEDLVEEKRQYLRCLSVNCPPAAEFTSNLSRAQIIERFSSADSFAYAGLDRFRRHIPANEAVCLIAGGATAEGRSECAAGTFACLSNREADAYLYAIEALSQRIFQHDAFIGQQLHSIPTPLTSVGGIGEVYAAGILAEIGDISRFNSHAALANYAKIAWTPQEADGGVSLREKSHLRYYLLEAANALRRCDPEFRRFYTLKYNETAPYPHKRALTLTARKLVRLVYVLLAFNRMYIPPES